MLLASTGITGPALAQPEPPAQATPPVPTPPEAAPPVPAAPPAVQPGPLDLLATFSRAQLAAAGFERQEAEIGGRKTVWWQAGEGPTVVLIHGVSDQAGTWFRVAPALAKDHRVLLIDLPGHGGSAPADGPLAMTTVLGGFERWLAMHAVPDDDAPVLVGNSMGAWVAMLAAHRHPERVGRVIAVNGGALRADTGGLDLLPADREEARRLMAALRDPTSPPIPDPVLDDLVRRAQDGHVRRMHQEQEDLESHLLDGRLGEIKTPVDVLWGEADRYLGRDYPDRLVAELPHARLTLLERCGHLPQAECPDRFLETLQALLAVEPPGEEGDSHLR